MRSASSEYNPRILGHYRNPQNFGTIENPSRHQKKLNAVCGDEMEIFVKFRGTRVGDVKFRGRGCALSMAAASLLTERAKGMSKAQIGKLNRKSINALLGTTVSPAREPCALLALQTLQEAIKS